MIFLSLFITFFGIGLFGFGGGYGMLSLIQTETVVHHGWISSAEFTNMPDDSRPHRHQFGNLLRLCCRTQCGVWQPDVGSRIADGDIRSRAAIADTDDTYMPHTDEVYEDTCRSECFHRTAPSRRGTSSGGNAFADEQRELLVD